MSETLPTSKELDDVARQWNWPDAEHVDCAEGKLFRDTRNAQHRASTAPLLAEIGRLKGEKEIGSLLVEHGVAALRARVTALEEALEWYANPKNYDGDAPGEWIPITDDDAEFSVDNGRKARKALGGSK